WGAVSSRLGELFHLKEWKKYLGKDAPFVLNLMIEAPQLGWLPWEMLRPGPEEPPFSLSPDGPFLQRWHDRTPAPSLGAVSQVHSGPAGVDVLFVPPARPVRGEAKSQGMQAESNLFRLYAGQGARVEQMTRPDPKRLAGAIMDLRPRVLHIAAALRARGPR